MFQASKANGSWAMTRPMCTAVATTYAANRTRQTVATPSRTTGEATGAQPRGAIDRAVGVFARTACSTRTRSAGLQRSRRVRAFGPRDALSRPRTKELPMKSLALITTLAMSFGTAAVAAPVRVADRDDAQVQWRDRDR